jgi:fused signal recognition particle receptor
VSIIIGVLVVVALLVAVGLFLFRGQGERSPGAADGRATAADAAARPPRTPEVAERLAPKETAAPQEGAEPDAPPAPAARADATIPLPTEALEEYQIADEEEAAPAPSEEEDAPAAEPAAARGRPALSEAERTALRGALRKGLAPTRGGFVARLAALFGRKEEIDPELLDEMQEVLLTADIGVQTADGILDRLKARMEEGTLKEEAHLWETLKLEAETILERAQRPLDLSATPAVVLVVGVNGVGKTTTIGKLASRLKDQGNTVLLAAGDTFRAAAVLQLEMWGRRVGCDVVKGKAKADPASVIYDAIKQAQEVGADIVLADTAGRLHTKAGLMDELQKVHRTAEKALGRPVDEVLLVLDSTTGQNAIQQAAQFREAVPVSGIALTKLDGTAKGGVILGIVDQHELPVRFIGVGERVEDLQEFEPEAFISALFEADAE